MTGTLQAGAARRVVNPPLGTRQTGFRLFGNPVQAIESDLTATALVLADGTTKVVVIAIDLSIVASTSRCAGSGPARSCASRSPRRSACPSAHVLLNTSHAHAGVALPDYMPDTPEQMRLKERYRGVPDRGRARRGRRRGGCAAAAGPDRLRLGREHDRRLPPRDPRRPRRPRRGARSPDRPVRRRASASTTSTATRSPSPSATRATRSRWGRAPPSPRPTSRAPRGASSRRASAGSRSSSRAAAATSTRAPGMGFEVDCRDTEEARRARARRRGRQGGRAHPHATRAPGSGGRSGTSPTSSSRRGSGSTARPP